MHFYMICEQLVNSFDGYDNLLNMREKPYAKDIEYCIVKVREEQTLRCEMNHKYV